MQGINRRVRKPAEILPISVKVGRSPTVRPGVRCRVSAE